MSGSDRFQQHWVDIDPERMERYETMFQWNPATEHFYAAARIKEGNVVGDFGCGPGHALVEFARRVGPNGHVHGFDINAEFLQRAKVRANEAGVGDQVTVHLLENNKLPIAKETLDRIIARNTIIYVDDPVFTFTEFKRVLRSGGIAHTIEGDWRMTAVEPVPTKAWRALIEAASWAWPRPEIGRQLYGIARRAGFEDVSLQVLTSPDTDGRLHGMIKTVAGYAQQGEGVETAHIEEILETVETAISQKTYLAISPQFIVTAIR